MKKKDLQRTRKLIGGMAIPSRPTVMLEVIKAQNAFAPDLQKVAEVISGDVVLSSRVLQEANTVLPGLRRKVGSIEQAVMLLGLAAVRRVVTNLFLNTSLISKQDPLQQLRQRCTVVGRAVAYLAQHLPLHASAYRSGYLPLIPPDEAYALGLFHDCGLSVLMQKYADYQSFYEELRQDGSRALVEAEEHRFRTNHCAVGYLLCEQWQLPPELCQVIRDHHAPPGFSRPGKKLKDRRSITMYGLLKLGEYLGGELSAAEWDGVRGDLYQFFGIGDAEMTVLRQGYDAGGARQATTAEEPASGEG